MAENQIEFWCERQPSLTQSAQIPSWHQAHSSPEKTGEECDWRRSIFDGIILP